MKKFKLKHLFVVCLIVCSLFTQGNMIVFAADTGVVLYKNDVFVGEYTTVNKAFDQMVDTTADYRVELKTDQTLTGYADWPVVNSIKIMPYDLQEGVAEGNMVNLIVTEDDITIHSDVCFSDWLCFRPEQKSGQISYVDFDIQNFELSFDKEIEGHTVSVGCEENAGDTGVNIKGESGSSIVLNETALLYNSSIQVDTLEMTTENCEVALYDSAIKNTVKHVIAPYGNGITISNAQLEIDAFTEMPNMIGETNPVTQYLWLEGTSKAVIGDMYNNCQLSIDYLDMETVENSTVSIIGEVMPQTVAISAAVNHQIYNADASRFLTFEKSDACLLYAPNLESGKVSVVCKVYNEFNEEVYGEYSYYGQIDGVNGYYNTDAIPSIQFSDSLFMAETTITGSLEYSNANASGDLKSVSWKIHEMGLGGYVDNPELDKDFGWDAKSLGFHITGLKNTSTYLLNGYFSYENGTISVVIPIFVSPTVSTASFDASEKTLVNPSFTVGQWIKLNYTATTTPNVVWTTSNPGVVSIVGSGVNATQKINGYGSAVVKAYIGNKVLTCNVMITDKDPNINGWHKDSNGDWYYYKDGKVDTSRNGIIQNGNEYWYAVKGKADFTVKTVALYNNSWWYVNKGKVDFSFTGLAQNYQGWWYVSKGKVDLTYEGVVTNSSGTWYVKNGKVNFDINGLAACGGSWYYFKGGAVQNVTGLYQNSAGWWYVKNGKIDFTHYGVVKNSSGLWYVKDGKVNFNINGLAQCGSDWYYFKGGAVQNVTGLYQNSAGYWYVKDGKIDFTYYGVVNNNAGTWYVKGGQVNFGMNGLAQCGGTYDWYYFKGGAVQNVTGLYQNSAGYWYVKNGKIDFNYTGLANNSAGYWYVKNGKIDFSYFGVASNNAGTWYVKGGQVNFGINGLAQCGSSTDWYYFKGGAVQKVTGLYQKSADWWYVKDGKVDFSYTGLANNSAGWWYVKDGKVDFSYTGLANNSAGWWYVKNGKIDFAFTGIAENDAGFWYCANGKVDFTFTGTIEYGGYTWKVVNGKATRI